MIKQMPLCEESLKYLYIDNTESITELPDDFEVLKHLSCSNSKLNSLPILPSSLTYLDISNTTIM